MFVYPLHISRTTERHACLHLVFTLHQQFKKLLPCVDSINDSLNLEGLISCLQGSSEGEISECLLNTMKTFFFLRMCCWKRQLVNVGKLVCLSTLNHAKTNSPAKSAQLLRQISAIMVKNKTVSHNSCLLPMNSHQSSQDEPGKKLQCLNFYIKNSKKQGDEGLIDSKTNRLKSILRFHSFFLQTLSYAWEVCVSFLTSQKVSVFQLSLCQ